MLTISISTMVGLIAFFLGYAYRTFSKERATLFPASAPASEDLPLGILSERFSVRLAKEIKQNFESNYSSPSERFTKTVFFDLEALKEYIAAIEPFLDELNKDGQKIKALGAYFALTNKPVRGRQRADIVIPENKLAIFLAPVLYEEMEVEDPFPGGDPGNNGKRKIINKDSIKDVFSLIEKGEITGDDDLAFDISHTEP